MMMVIMVHGVNLCTKGRREMLAMKYEARVPATTFKDVSEQLSAMLEMLILPFGVLEPDRPRYL
jgi:hypothetical protein